MSRFYTPLFALLILLHFTGCSKDFLKTYEKRIIGNWQITDIDGYGFGSFNNFPFNEDETFSFAEDGKLIHNSAGRTYQGSWDVRKEHRDEKTIQSLHITAIDFATQDVKTEYFNDIAFTTSNRFKAFINNGTKIYVYHFVRK